MTNRTEATLSEWLLERLSDHEVEIRTGIGHCQSVSDHRTGRLLARLLRHSEAMRRVVELHTPEDIGYGDCPKCDGRYDEHEFYPCQTLRFLALPYADRPGYRDEWRP